MKRLMLAMFVGALVAALPAAAQSSQEKIVVEGKKVVELADGGSITIDDKGNTYHVDAKGKRVRMKDGVVMTGKDGARYLHKNDAIWKQIVEKGTLAPNR